ncbi:MAG: helix-turn-helix domain-containing protein [Pleurocapsa minor HA4230-MV1]|jgi:predicted XRE-type DNA-binding protein|nr:helix-turn-helix domain-containing protein [Pleurocapsa minor HA4230-MV1]
MDREQNFIVTHGSENIFDDLGFEKSEAANLKIRADLMLALKEYIQSQDWSQEQAAEFFQETQPRISNLINGEISRFSVDKLINMLSRAGMEVKVEILSLAA